MTLSISSAIAFANEIPCDLHFFDKRNCFSPVSNLNKRFLALTSNEAVYVRSLEKRLFKLLTGLKQLRLSKKYKSHGISLAKAIAEEILRVITVPDVILP